MSAFGFEGELVVALPRLYDYSDVTMRAYFNRLIRYADQNQSAIFVLSRADQSGIFQGVGKEFWRNDENGRQRLIEILDRLAAKYEPKVLFDFFVRENNDNNDKAAGILTHAICFKVIRTGPLDRKDDLVCVLKI